MRRRAAELPQPAPRVPVEQRIRTAADAMFRRYGVHAVSLRAIAGTAETKESTVHDYFGSKDHLIRLYLEPLIETARGDWAELLADDPKTPIDKLRLWLSSLQHMALDGVGHDELERAASELTARYPLSQALVRKHIHWERAQVVKLYQSAGCREPIALADKLYLLVEGARVGATHTGPQGPCRELVAASETLIRSHTPGWPR